MQRLLIKGGTLISMDENIGDLRGDILIEDGQISEVGHRLEAPDGVETIDATGFIVMPGLVDSHLHTWQTAIRGIAGDSYRVALAARLVDKLKELLQPGIVSRL